MQTGTGPRRRPDDHHQVDSTALEADQYVVYTPRLHRFIADVRVAIAAASSVPSALQALQPIMGDLLAEDDWLPNVYAEPCATGGMGGGIGQWLLFRSAVLT